MHKEYETFILQLMATGHDVKYRLFAVDFVNFVTRQ